MPKVNIWRVILTVLIVCGSVVLVFVGYGVWDMAAHPSPGFIEKEDKEVPPSMAFDDKNLGKPIAVLFPNRSGTAEVIHERISPSVDWSSINIKPDKAGRKYWFKRGLLEGISAVALFKNPNEHYVDEIVSYYAVRFGKDCHHFEGPGDKAWAWSIDKNRYFCLSRRVDSRGMEVMVEYYVGEIESAASQPSVGQ